MELGIDRGTLQGWETARRPFTAVPFGQAVAVRHHLLRLGADPRLLSYLDDAAEADFLLAEIASNQGPVTEHPLGFSVLTRRVVGLIDWAVTGVRPHELPASKTGRRGPATDGPSPSWTELQEHARGSQLLIERSAGKPDHATILLHRQISFLAGPLAATENQLLLTREVSDQLVKPRPWNPHWSDARTVSIARAFAGDPEPLRDFMCVGFHDDEHELANLNYWAYYLGEVPERQTSDAFQLRNDLPWRGSRLLAHLVTRLDVDHPLLSLNIHTVWSLLSCRPGLIHDDPSVGHDLMARCGRLLDSDSLSPQARTELASIHYANRSDFR